MVAHKLLVNPWFIDVIDIFCLITLLLVSKNQVYPIVQVLRHVLTFQSFPMFNHIFLMRLRPIWQYHIWHLFRHDTPLTLLFRQLQLSKIEVRHILHEIWKVVKLWGDLSPVIIRVHNRLLIDSPHISKHPTGVLKLILLRVMNIGRVRL